MGCREREALEQEERERLRKEWVVQQEKMKSKLPLQLNSALGNGRRV